MKRKIVVIMMVMTMLVSSGCGTGFAQWWANNKSNLQLAIDIAVALVVKAHPNDAALIGKTAQAIGDAVSANTVVTLTDLNTFVVNQLNLPTLNPIDRKIMEDLLAKLEEPLSAYFIKQNITDPAQQLIVVKELSQMIVDSLGTPAMMAHIKAVKMKAASPNKL